MRAKPPSVRKLAKRDRTGQRVPWISRTRLPIDLASCACFNWLSDSEPVLAVTAVVVIVVVAVAVVMILVEAKDGVVTRGVVVVVVVVVLVVVVVVVV